MSKPGAKLQDALTAHHAAVETSREAATALAAAHETRVSTADGAFGEGTPSAVTPTSSAAS